MSTTTTLRISTPRRSLFPTSYTPRLPESTRSDGISVRLRLFEFDRACSDRPARYASIPDRAVLRNDPSRFACACAAVTPGFRRPITCSHHVVGCLSRGGGGAAGG